jgi:hypothetical protein
VFNNLSRMRHVLLVLLRALDEMKKADPDIEMKVYATMDEARKNVPVELLREVSHNLFKAMLTDLDGQLLSCRDLQDRILEISGTTDWMEELCAMTMLEHYRTIHLPRGETGEEWKHGKRA